MLCRYHYCVHFTSESVKSCQGHCTTIASTPEVIHEYIAWLKPCTLPCTPAAQHGRCTECSSTNCLSRWQHSPTQQRYIFDSVTVPACKDVHKDSMTNDFDGHVLHFWWSLETSDRSAVSLAGIRQSCCRCTISVSVTWWSIPSTGSTNPGICRC